jgi:hypothetical protein
MSYPESSLCCFQFQIYLTDIRFYANRQNTLHARLVADFLPDQDRSLDAVVRMSLGEVAEVHIQRLQDKQEGLAWQFSKHQHKLMHAAGIYSRLVRTKSMS